MKVYQSFVKILYVLSMYMRHQPEVLQLLNSPTSSRLVLQGCLLSRSIVEFRLMFFLLFYFCTSSSSDCLEFQFFFSFLKSVCNDSILKRNYRLFIQVIGSKFSRHYYVLVIVAKLNCQVSLFLPYKISELNVYLVILVTLLPNSNIDIPDSNRINSG